MQELAARENAVRQWTANPCGAIGGDETSLEYFLEVERRRYEEQPWQRERIRFEQYAGRRVLEIGVGLGTDLVQFAKAGAVCHGVDITDRHLELAARNFALRGLQVELRKCDATRIDFPSASFDVVYSFGVLHHIPDAAAVVGRDRARAPARGHCIVALYHKYSFFHLYMVLVRGLLLGRLFRLGYDGLMATVEGGRRRGRDQAVREALHPPGGCRPCWARLDVTRVSVHQVEIGRFRHAARRTRGGADPAAPGAGPRLVRRVRRDRGR